MKNRFIIRVASISLAAVAVMGATSALAAQGSSNDPLVTLSYLTDVVTPQLLGQVDDVVDQNEQALVAKLTALVESSDTTGSGAEATYTVVSLSAGQALSPAVGCEVMLRIGSASCVSPSSPGLIDTTTGNTLDNGGVLVTNHLYLTTITGRSICAGTNVKILVRGAYSVS